jgi:hypothetical protein
MPKSYHLLHKIIHIKQTAARLRFKVIEGLKRVRESALVFFQHWSAARKKRALLFVFHLGEAARLIFSLTLLNLQPQRVGRARRGERSDTKIHCTAAVGVCRLSKAQASAERPGRLAAAALFSIVFILYIHRAQNVCASGPFITHTLLSLYARICIISFGFLI